jgi:hypothetical protein
VPQDIIHELETKYKFKLKGTGPTTFHLGMEFSQNTDGVLCLSPKRYIDQMTALYHNIFGTNPCQKYSSPLEPGDHPEIDDSEFLDAHQTQQYQSLIGALQWVITIGQFDIHIAVMTLLSFHAMPQCGHMEHVKQIYGYLARMSEGVIRVQTGEPDYSALPHKEYDWE